MAIYWILQDLSYNKEKGKNNEKNISLNHINNTIGSDLCL